MSAALLGNLAGRLVASYALVWLAMLLVTRFDWHGAFRRTHRWYGIAGIVILFVLGIAGTAIKRGV